MLASTEPSAGVGVDFRGSIIELGKNTHPHLKFHTLEASGFVSSQLFDYFLLSDLVNDLPDVESFLLHLQSLAHPGKRVVMNFFGHLWHPFLKLAQGLGLKSPTPPQNWLATEDRHNLLYLAGWEVVKTDARILLPLKIPIISNLVNQWLAPFLHPLCLRVFLVARPRPRPNLEQHYSCSVVIPARNEAGNIEDAVKRVPEMGKGTEILFIEGHSKDNTWDDIQKLMDADLTVPPEELPKFYRTAQSCIAEFVNGVRLVYPMEDEAMRFLNTIANTGFGMDLFSARRLKYISQP